eukprot:786452_1
MAHFFTRFVRRLIRPRLNQHSLNHYRLHHHNRIPIEYTFSMLPVMLPIAEEDDEQGEDNNEEEKQKKKNVELNYRDKVELFAEFEKVGLVDLEYNNKEERDAINAKMDPIIHERLTAHYPKHCKKGRLTSAGMRYIRKRVRAWNKNRSCIKVNERVEEEGNHLWIRWIIIVADHESLQHQKTGDRTFGILR